MAGSFKTPIRFMVALLLIAHLLQPANALIHFYSETGSRRCFYKEIGQRMLLIGRYKMEIRDSDTNVFYSPRDKTNIGVLIDVEETFDSNHRVVHQKGFSSGQFTFSALESGEHRICLTPRSFLSKKWYGNSKDEFSIKDSKFKEARIMVDFLIGDGNMLDSKHTDKVKTLSEQVKRLNDKLADIRREQQFIREKEAHFRDQSERTCEKVVKWSIVQLGALFIVCIYQVLTLQRFFVKAKIA